MRIAHVTATFFPYAGGTGNVCYYNCRELVRRGHDVHVFTAACFGTKNHETYAGISIHRLKPLFQIGNAPILLNLPLALHDFDLIHMHYPFILGAELVRIASTMFNTPLVLTFHNDLIGNGARKHFFQFYQVVSGHITVRGIRRLCVVSLDHYYSSELYRSLKDHNANVVELPNGVDLSQFSPTQDVNEVRSKYGIPADVKVVLFVAALDRAHHFKGLECLINALQNIPPGVWLLIIGDGDLRPIYEHQAYELGVSDRTIFVGAIKHEDTPDFFRAANVTVLPSSPPESFGLVLIESLACGTPVIATRIPGVRTVVDHGKDGFLVETNSPNVLAEAIKTILDTKDLAPEMGRNGRMKVEVQYGWELIGERLESIYCQVLEEHRTTSNQSPNIKRSKPHREANS